MGWGWRGDLAKQESGRPASRWQAWGLGASVAGLLGVLRQAGSLGFCGQMPGFEILTTNTKLFLKCDVGQARQLFRRLKAAR